MVEPIGNGEWAEKAGVEFAPLNDFPQIGFVKRRIGKTAKDLVEKTAFARGAGEQGAEGGLLDDEAVVHFPDCSSSARAASSSIWETQAGLSRAALRLAARVGFLRRARARR